MRRLFRSKIFIFLILGFIIGTLIILEINFSFLPLPGKNNKSAKETVHTVKRETIKQTLTISGKIDADEKSTVRFQSSGKIAWIGVKKGDSVKKYQALASQDTAELQKNLKKYLNTYMDSRWDFEQTKDEYREPAQGYWNLSWDQRRGLDRALQKAQFDMESSVLDVEIKNIALRSATIYSPIDGIVTRIDTPFPGIYATPTQAEFEIINPDSLYFSLLPDQTEVTNLSASMSAEIILDAYPDEKISGTIRDIAFTPKTGETSTVYEVKIQSALNDPSHTRYRLGMTGDATFTILEKRDVLAIPPTFIKSENGKKYVLKQSAKKKEKIFIETGAESDDLVEITGGLAEGDVIYD